MYLTVNENFRTSQGRNFMGSRDIDLGFHVDPEWTDAELRGSTFAKAIARIEEAGFKPLSFRFVKYFHTETKQELSEEGAKKVSQAFIFDMYVDPIVDSVHPRFEQILGFIPIDEPMLSEVFLKERSITRNDFGTKMLLPKPAVLLATKLNSVANRDKEHKRIKDIADIYGLTWYSGDDLVKLREELFGMVAKQKVASVTSSFNDRDYEAVARNLGVDKTEISAVIAELKP